MDGNSPRKTRRTRSGGRLFVGLMSGTSVDGIDAALVNVTRARDGRYGAEVLHHVEFPHLPEIRDRLLRVMAPATTTTQEICELNVAVAEAFGCAAKEVILSAGYRTGQITAIGSHGQTICHLPRRGTPSRFFPSTLQIGDPSVIACLADVTTVGNFRPVDIFVGGEGAPLVPWTDDMLLSHASRRRCVQNIGGIANVTYLPPLEEKRRTVLAFDTGPGNMLIDAMVSEGTGGKQRYDKDGRLASRGTLDVKLFRELQGHPYFERRPPKSTGREEFGAGFAKTLPKGRRRFEDVVHTVTRLTAWSIADAYLHFLPELPEEVILCGGGADNLVLVRMLGEEFAGMRSEFTGQRPPRILRIDDFGIPNKAKEAASFALLAAATIDGVPANLPSVTGAARAVVLGVVARP